MKSHLLPGQWLEDEFVVKKVKSYLPSDKKLGRKSALVQFWCRDTGGLRTVRARDIIHIK